MARVSSYSTTELAHPDANLLSFPEKLWWIVNNPKRGEIHWSTHGTSIVIPSTQRFVAEVLNNPSSALFKTKNFASFVRQLNLYGFRKVTEYPRRTPPSTLSLSSRCEFKHPFFRKGRRDLLLHVKRQLYTPRKTEDRQQRSRTLPPKEKQFDQNPGSVSLNASWNPSLYTPMPFVPWQAPLQMPFTLYAPFCNPYQLAQMQHGPMPVVPNIQGLGLPGQFQQGTTDPSVIGPQSYGFGEGGTKSCASAPLTQQGLGSTGAIHSHGALQVETSEGVNNPNSSSLTKSTGIGNLNSTPNATVVSNASPSTVYTTNVFPAKHNGLSASQTIATDGNSLSFTTQKNEQETRHPLRSKSTDVCFAGSRPFAAHVLHKETAESFVSGSQSLVLEHNEGSSGNITQDLCHRKEITGARLD